MQRVLSFDNLFALVLLAAPSLVALGTRGVPSPTAFLMSHATFLPAVLARVVPSRLVSDLRLEHIVRHTAYACSASFAVFGVHLASWNDGVMAYYIAVQCSLYIFALTHVLEYLHLIDARTHFGDTPVLSFLLLATGMFLTQNGTEYVFLHSVLLAVPLRVAMSTLMLLAHAEFAHHSTTRTEHPAFLKSSHVGVALASLFACLVEADCQFSTFAFLPIFASLWAMCLDPTSPMRRPPLEDLLGLALGAALASAVAFWFYERVAHVAVLGVAAVFLFGVVGRYLFDRGAYVPTTLLASYCTAQVAQAWDPADVVPVALARAAAWAVVFGTAFWMTRRLDR